MRNARKRVGRVQSYIGQRALAACSSHYCAPCRCEQWDLEANCESEFGSRVLLESGFVVGVNSGPKRG
jgi:hypothetical protein